MIALTPIGEILDCGDRVFVATATVCNSFDLNHKPI